MRNLTHRHILSVILLLSAVVRFWGLDFGLPNERCRPDESMIIIVAMGMGNGDLNPHFFNYPTLFIYLCFAGFVAYYAFGTVFGFFHSAQDFALAFFLDPSVFYLISRTLSAAAGIATVYLVYLIGRKLQDERTGLLASLLLALAPLHVRDSHFGVTDVTMTLFIVSAVYFSLKRLAEKKWRFSLLAAAFTGLAAASKYNGLFGLAPVLFAVWLEQRQLVPFIKQAFWCIALFAVVFIAASPFVLLDYSAFLRDFSFEMSHLASGHMGIDLGRGWWHHASFSLWYGMGPGLFLLALVGAFLLLRQAPKPGLVLLAFPLLFYLVIGRGLVVFARYALPLIPFLSLSAAWGTLSLFDRLWYRRRSLLLWAVPALAGAVLLPNLHQVIQSDRLLSRKDSRVLAAEWMSSHVPSGASIYQHATYWAQVQLPATLASMDFFASDSAAAANPGLAQLYRRRHEHYTTSATPVYAMWTRLDSSFYCGRRRQQALPDYIITTESGLYPHDLRDPDIDRLLASRYQQIHTVQASAPAEGRSHYDLQDAFFLPLAGFAAIERPGPNIRIYKKESCSTP